MISSAVVIPEQQSPPHSPHNTLKRRQSSVTSESSKRPRLDTQNDTDLSRNGLPSPQSAMSPPRRKTILTIGAAEEKKRGQRLFGALLGTLSQSGSTKPVHRKRDEIEQRQRERAKKENDDREEEQRRRRARLDQLRRVEQTEWDAESVRIRHRNMRAMAGFLNTQSEPVLYYKPWEMRLEEKETIERQIREVEETIRSESEGGHRATKSDAAVRRGEAGGTQDHKELQSQSTDAKGDPGEDTNMKQTLTPDSDELVTKSGPERVEMLPATTASSSAKDALNPDIREEKSAKMDDDHDHGGEELVEGQEDDVIY